MIDDGWFRQSVNVNVARSSVICEQWGDIAGRQNLLPLHVENGLNLE